MGEKLITVNGQTYRLDNYYPAVCTETEFARLQEAAVANRMPQGQHKQVITLLSGLGVLRCSHCGGSMSFFSKEARIRYVCETGKNRTSDCRVWSMQGALVEALTMRAIIHGHISSVLSGGIQAESVAPLIEDKRQVLIAVDERIENMTQAIMLGGNLAPLVAALTSLEEEKKVLLLEIDRLTQQEALRGGDSDIEVKILEVLDLLTPELLTDVTHQGRLKIREVVRLILPAVTLSKQSDKSLTVDFRFPDNSHLTYKGVMNGSEKSYCVSLRDEDDPYTDEPGNVDRIEKLKSEMASAFDRLLIKVEEVARLQSLPALNGKDFFGKR